MKRLCLLLAAVLLSACAARAPLPAQLPQLALPMQLHVQREQAGQHQDWLLVIQQEPHALRWTLLDLLGIPLARQLLDDGRWQAEGLLPPNPAARELFAALLFALTDEQALPAAYPGAEQQANQRKLGQRWTVIYQQPDQFTLKLDHGLRYLVSPLPIESTP
ncbi:DUF3261 domain-containing protein [Pseudomonas fontis]|uniref:DUF3261 domain-containing protein n=1 Tax=Pseudomonas fontis TaxID=2942633 RepID=A0ABT5NS17_9PSED|nr:DUF3261 domain-containing protein [Pseudomonas fontis]MDD0973664.1 DUF3261 domain-containing protein [Pseudomonas fontis]MDD0990961.1 DUF3261 domain-containing protein [Pseudomonas fontis]